MTTFHISGRVIDHKTRQGLTGLRVEGWDKDLICNDLVGSALTDEQGAFQIMFNESYFRELFLDRQPDLFFKVFCKGNLIESTEDSVLWNGAAEETQIVIEIKEDKIMQEQAAIAQRDCTPIRERIQLLEDIIAEQDCDSLEGIPQRARCFARVRQLNRELRDAQASLRNCEAGLPNPGIIQTSGRVTFLRVNDTGGFGPPNDFLDAEVIFQLSTESGRSFGFQLRNDDNRPAREAMFSLLEQSLLNGLTVVVDYRQELNKFNAIAFRIALLERSRFQPPVVVFS